jgi:hypothetical protein
MPITKPAAGDSPWTTTGDRIVDEMNLRGVMTADVGVTASTALVDATGLSVTVLGSAWYGFDAWLNYNASVAGDFKCGLALVTTTIGSGGAQAGLVGPSTGFTPNAGSPRINYVDFGTFDLSGATYTTAGDQEFAGSVFVASRFSGYINTDVGGTAKIQFAQYVASGTTTLKKGSWLKFYRLD